MIIWDILESVFPKSSLLMLYKLQRKAAKFGRKKTVRVAAKRRIIRIADRFNSSLNMDYGTVFEEMTRKHKHKETNKLPNFCSML